MGNFSLQIDKQRVIDWVLSFEACRKTEDELDNGIRLFYWSYWRFHRFQAMEFERVYFLMQDNFMVSMVLGVLSFRQMMKGYRDEL